MEIIHSLVQGIGGKLQILPSDNNRGARFTVAFSTPKYGSNVTQFRRRALRGETHPSPLTDPLLKGSCDEEATKNNCLKSAARRAKDDLISKVYVAGLTQRERQVISLVLDGRPSKIIALDLGISQRTVENHRASIMKKTGCKSLPALCRVAFALA